MSEMICLEEKFSVDGGGGRCVSGCGLLIGLG